MVFFYKLVFLILMWMGKMFGPNVTKKVVILGLKSQIFQPQKRFSARLKTVLFGQPLKTPIGLSAEFDRNGKMIDLLAPLGLSFGELGSFTLLADSTREKVMFLKKFKALYIQAVGAPNPGVSKAAQILAARRQHTTFIGASIISFGSEGEYRTSTSAVYGYGNDYHQMAMKVAPYVDYVLVNLSHPNMSLAQMLADETTLLPMLLDIKGALMLAAPLKTPKLVIKVPYDLSDLEVKLIAETSKKAGVEGIIVAGPAVATRQMRSLFKTKGVMSMDSAFVTGALLKKDVMQLVKRFYLETKGQIDIVASGCVFTAQDVYDLIANGATAVQLGAVLLYKGPDALIKMNKELVKLLEKNSETVESLRGSNVDMEAFLSAESKKDHMNYKPDFVD